MKKALFISGGHMNVRWASDYVENKRYQMIIAIDGGLERAEELGIVPTHIVGDFDTVRESVLKKYLNIDNIIVKRLCPEKDATDTEVAIKMAIEEGCDAVDIIAGTGTRIDHTIANIHVLQLFLEKEIEAVIVNENNRIRLINRNYSMERTQAFGKYVSFLPFTDVVEGFGLSGFKYPVKDITVNKSNWMSLGVSNEIVDEKCLIEVKKGILIMIESID